MVRLDKVRLWLKLGAAEECDFQWPRKLVPRAIKTSHQEQIVSAERRKKTQQKTWTEMKMLSWEHSGLLAARKNGRGVVENVPVAQCGAI